MKEPSSYQEVLHNSIPALKAERYILPRAEKKCTTPFLYNPMFTGYLVIRKGLLVCMPAEEPGLTLSGLRHVISRLHNFSTTILMKNIYLFLISLFWCMQSVFAQSPGGVAGAGIWLKADAGVTSASGTVASWTDQVTSVNLTNTKAAIGAAPTTGTATMNFNPTVSFSGGQSIAANNGEIQESSVITQTVPGSVVSSTHFIAYRNKVPNFGSFLYWYANFCVATTDIAASQSGQMLVTGGQWSPNFGSTPTLSANQCMITSAAGGLTADPSNVYSYLNGKDQGNRVTENVPQLAGNAKFFVGSCPSTTSYANADIGEIIAFPSAIANTSSTAKNRVESYLALKYGISLDQTTATDYLASDGTTKMWSNIAAAGYTNNIFGIGRDDNSQLLQKVSASQNSRGIVTVALDNDFTSLNNAAARTSTFAADKNFFTISDNSSATGNPVWTSTSAPAGKQILSSQWQVQTNAAAQPVFLQFDVANSNYDVPALSAGTSYYLVYDNGGTISASSQLIQLVNTSGNLWSTALPVNFSNGAKFTLAVGTLPSPGGVPGAAVWLKADATADITLSGSNIATWADHSGNGNNTTAIAGSAGNTIAYSATSNLFNFNPAATFKNTFGRIALNTPIPMGNTTNFTVCKRIGATGFNSIWSDGGIGTHIIPLCNGATLGLWNGGYGSSSFNWADNERALVTAVLQAPVSNVSAVTLFKNGAASTNPLSMGVASVYYDHAGTGGDGSAFGDIPETIIYSSGSLTSVQIQRIQSYMALKYGISLDQTTATDYLASDGVTKMWSNSTAAGYTNNIFGIGRDDNSQLLQKVSASQNGRGIVTAALQNDFVSANNAAARTATFAADNSFITISDNSAAGNPTWTGSSAPAGKLILSSQWQVQTNAAAQPVFLQFDVANSNYDVPALVAGSSYYLVYDNSGTISPSSQVVPLVNTSGSLWSLSSAISFPNGTKFTLASVAPPSPGGVAGASVWLKADATADITLSGSNIAAWADHSGNGNNTTTIAGSGGSGVAYNATSNLFNYNPTATFIKNLGRLGLNATGTIAMANTTNFTIAKRVGATTFNSIWADNTGFYSLPVVNPPSTLAVFNGGVGASSFTWADQERALVTAVIKVPVSNVSAVTLLKNGAASTIQNKLKSASPTIYYDHAGTDDDVDAFGDIPEMIVYPSGYLTNDQVQRVQSYMALKYGISLDQTTATDYLASDGVTKMWSNSAAAGYINNIFGIGRDDNSQLLQKISASQSGRGIVTAALQNDFTSANNAAARTATFAADNSFITISDNSAAGNPTWTGSSAPAGKLILSSQWQVQTNAAAQPVFLQFDVANSNYDVPALVAGSSYYLVYDNGGTISPSSTTIPLVNTSGSLWSLSSAISFPNGAKFTLASVALPSPGGVAGEALWFKADATADITLSGSNIATWADHSSNGNNTTAIAGSAGNTITYSASSNLFNFNPAATFTKNFGRLGLNATGTLTMANSTNFTIAKRIGSSFNGIWADNTGFYSLPAVSNASVLAVWNGGLGASSLTWANQERALVTAVIKVPVGVVSAVTLIKNGLASTIQNKLKSASPTVYYDHFGSYEDVDAFGDIPETIVYPSGYLTNDQVQRVQSYMALKYGISLDQTTATDYIASDGTTKMWSNSAAAGYINNIFGIGRDDNSQLLQKVSASQNTRGILTAALQNDFVSANIATARTATFTADNSFITISDNSAATGNPSWTATAAPSGKLILSSQWQVQTNAAAQPVFLQFDVANSNYDVPTLAGGSSYYLVYDNSGTISPSSQVITLVNTSGSLWSLSSAISFSNGAKFTLASAQPQSPAGVPANVWFKADAGINASGNIVNSWTDQSANNWIASKVSSAGPDTSLNKINFNPAVTFSSSTNNGLATPAAGNSGAMPESNVVNGVNNAQFIVYKSAAGSITGINYRYGLDNNPVTNPWNIGNYYSSSTNGAFTYKNAGATAATTTSPSTVYLADIFSNSSGSSSSWNGVVGTALNGTSTTTGDALFFIGAGSTSTGSSTNSAIAEIITYNTDQTTNKNKIESYLALKYGISISQTTATDYLASDGTTTMWSAGVAGPFGYNIFGIGRDDNSGLLQKVSASQNVRGILTVALDNDFASNNNAAARTATFNTDKNFFTISDNSGASGNPAWTMVSAPTGKALLNYNYRSQTNISGGQAVFLQFDVANTNLDVPSLLTGTNYYLIYDNSGNYSASSTVVPLVNTSGSLWSTSLPVTLGNGARFTLATDIAPLVPDVIAPSQTICGSTIPPTPLTVTAAASGGCGGYIYYWQYSTDNGTTWTNDLTATGNTYTFTTAINVQTLYRRKVYDACGITATSVPDTIYISTPPSLTTSPDTLICPRKPATIRASSTDGTIEWTNLGTNNNYVVTPATSTSYVVTATNVAGCKTSHTVKVDVDPVNAVLTASPTPVKADSYVTLTASGINNFSVLAWTPTASFSNQTANIQTLIILDTTLYSVVIKSQSGCTDTAFLKVIPEPNDKDFFMPNAFTPNGDGNNDVFKVYGRSVKEIEMRVFNQWGQLLFETKDPATGWNGYYKNVLQPAGPYIYTVRGKLYSGKEFSKKSTFNLVR
ncbi:MAG: gliding motility-associated C-terminal domain-containing protein [Chitinophagaceae bacterium]